jgi:hypothetical protein
MNPALALLCTFALPTAPETGHVDHVARVEIAGAHGMAGVALPRFDPALGELVRVEIGLAATVGGILAVENLAPTATQADAELCGRAAVLFPGLAPLALALEGTASRFLAGFDGACDYTGVSGWRFPVECGSAGATQLTGDLGPFVAEGTQTALGLVFGARTSVGCNGSELAQRRALSTRIELRLRYVYVPAESE